MRINIPKTFIEDIGEVHLYPNMVYFDDYPDSYDGLSNEEFEELRKKRKEFIPTGSETETVKTRWREYHLTCSDEYSCKFERTYKRKPTKLYETGCPKCGSRDIKVTVKLFELAAEVTATETHEEVWERSFCGCCRRELSDGEIRCEDGKGCREDWLGDILDKLLPADHKTANELFPGSLSEVKAKFRSLSVEHHPDHNGDAEHFREIQRLYEYRVNQLQKEVTQ